MTRRFFIILLALVMFTLLLDNAKTFILGDGQVRFFTYYLQENGLVRYRDGNRLSEKGLRQVAQIFRSRESDKTHPIDSRLISLIDQIEDHFQVRQVEIISGYRSDQFNDSLKKSGHSVAHESFHTKGMAADIHLDEITEEALRDYAVSLKKGGVGYYPSLHMVHLDVGFVRYWEEKAPRKNWVGEKNEDVSAILTVTPDRSVGEKSLKELKIEGDDEIESQLTIEFFDSGKWAEMRKMDLSTKENTGVRTVFLESYQKDFQKLPWGKFRLKAIIKKTPDSYQYSNEFYFKRM